MTHVSSLHIPPVPDDLTVYQTGLAWEFLRQQPGLPEATLAEYLDAAYVYAKEQPETYAEAEAEQTERDFWRQAFG